MNFLSPNMGGTRRSYFNRTFGKLSKGSLRGSIFALCASAIGSGVLSLPYVLALCGWVIGVSFIIIGAIAACWSLILIAEGSVLGKVGNLNALAVKAGGTKLQTLL
jgi:amino acid permease